MKAVLMIIATLFTFSLLESCYYDKEELLYPGSKLPCDTSTVAKFAADVMPVMSANCNSSGCHNSIDAASGVILDTYNGVKTQALNGRLMGSIDILNGTMPKGAGKLANCTIVKIQQWINTGTPNN